MPFTGCAYYPEHWSQERWAEDVRLMQAAGLSVVRLGEFAWNKFEPVPGTYDFTWLDEAVTLIAETGLQVVMCTPTATPPPWLTQLHPEICRVEPNGVRVSPGARRHACASVPAYLEYSRLITEKITAHYGQHPAVIGWQIDNEFGCGETTRCHCQDCRALFHRWLQNHYGSLEALNEAWGTQFWGMTYGDWQQIPIPGITTEPQSPSMRLDYRRFASDRWCDFQRMQIELIRRNSPGRFVTHNFMIRHWSLDYWRLAQDLDFISYDNYPHGLRDAAEVSMNHDLMRSFKNRHFWVMEQQPGRVNWHPYNPPVPPGQVRVWSHQAIAHGAEAVVYFRFRAGRIGQEQYHAGLFKWDYSPDQCFYEAQQVRQEVENLPHLSRPQAKTAILFDYNDLWAIELEPLTQQFSYWELVYALYKVFWEANIPIDFLPRGADLSGYERVILPAGFLIHPGEAEQWRGWVEAGGQLLITFRTGYRTLSSTATEMSLPAGFTDLIGARIREFHTSPPPTYTQWEAHRPGRQVQAADSTHPFGYKIWAESLQPDQAQPLYQYSDGMLRGQAAAVVNTIGQGRVYYLGCWLDDFASFMRHLGWVQSHHAPVQSTILQGNDGSLWQIKMNHAAVPVDGLEGFGVRYEKVGDHE